MPLDPDSAHMLRTGLRRAAWILGLLVTVVLAAWIAENGITEGAREMRSAWQAADITGYQAAWVTLSIAAVLAVYWWGVGSGSRYEPPPIGAVTSTGAVNTPSPQSSTPPQS